MSDDTAQLEAPDDTIFALASGAGVCGIAVIRISGPGTGDVLEAIGGTPRPAARLATLRTIQDPRSGTALDQGLVLWFPAPHSFTGEDQAELHLHGGRAVVAGALDALMSLPGCRLARPGEFARRAFDHGKLDLAAVEGLADLIAAETEAQRRQAFRQMRGALGVRCENLRSQLVGALARLEAEIDFAEDEVDVPQGALEETRRAIGAALLELETWLAEAGKGERMRDGIRIAIVGAPNVGKSSLLNALAQRDVAIVSETAGTTRDVIEVHLDLGGLPATLADTAGLRALEGPNSELGETQGAAAALEAEGMRRARLRAEDADLILAVFDATRWPAVEADVAALVSSNGLVVVNKADLAPETLRAALEGPSPALPEALTGLSGAPRLVSALTGDGVTGLVEALRAAVEGRLGGGGDALVTRARHREALVRCQEALRRVETAESVELLAEDLRVAVRALGRITGRVDVEDILDVIFRDFCIGK